MGNLIDESTERLLPLESGNKEPMNKPGGQAHYQPPTTLLLAMVIALGVILLCEVYFFASYLTKNSKYNKLISEGQNYVSQGQYSEAINKFDEAIRINKKRHEAYELKMNAQTISGDYTGALESVNDLAQNGKDVNGIIYPITVV